MPACCCLQELSDAFWNTNEHGTRGWGVGETGWLRVPPRPRPACCTYSICAHVRAAFTPDAAAPPPPAPYAAVPLYRCTLPAGVSCLPCSRIRSEPLKWPRSNPMHPVVPHTLHPEPPPPFRLLAPCLPGCGAWLRGTQAWPWLHGCGPSPLTAPPRFPARLRPRARCVVVGQCGGRHARPPPPPPSLAPPASCYQLPPCRRPFLHILVGVCASLCIAV